MMASGRHELSQSPGDRSVVTAEFQAAASLGALPVRLCVRARRDPAMLTLAPTVAVRLPIHGEECIHPLSSPFTRIARTASGIYARLPAGTTELDVGPQLG